MSRFPVRWTSAQPKSDLIPVKVERKRRKSKREALDEVESAKVRLRSGGRCEVCVINPLVIWSSTTGGRVTVRCKKRALHVHHMIGGHGVRGRGKSALAQHKQHVCVDHHSEIGGTLTGKLLKRIGGEAPLWTDYYKRR